MVITVMGTAASGKSDFAVGYAAAWGKEGIYLVTEPAGQAIIPDRTKVCHPAKRNRHSRGRRLRRLTICPT